MVLQCAHCAFGLSVGSAMQCASCRSVRYCGRDCQKAAWKGHRKECKASCAEAAAKVGMSTAAFGRVREHVDDIIKLRRAQGRFVVEMRVRFNAGEFKRVLEMQAEAVGIAESMRDDPEAAHDAPGDVSRAVNIACVYALLGASMRSLGDFHHSLEMYRAAKVAVDRVGAALHPCKFPFYTNLAFVLQDLNHTAEALQLHQQLETMTRGSPPDVRLVALSSFAGFFAKAGNYAEALKLYPVLVGEAVAAGDTEQTARSLEEFANVSMMAGQPVAAHALYERCRALALGADNAVLHVKVVAGLATCKWTEMILAGGGEAALLLFSEHLREARALLQNPATRQVDVLGRVLLLTAFERRLLGDDVSARQHTRELLSLMARNSRECCSSCGQGRDREHPLVKCGHCKVVRFCNERCKLNGSAGDRSNTHHVVAHRYVCKMLCVHRLMEEDADDAQETAAHGATMEGLVDTFLDKMTEDATQR